MNILFLDTCNLNEFTNPVAAHIEISDDFKNMDLNKIFTSIEKTQEGVGHIGGNWKKIMDDLGINYTYIKGGHKSDFPENKHSFDLVYTVISGNY